jgi:hypothetical protein
MALEKMTNREQVLVLIVIATFVGGAYGLLRYVPQTKVLSELNATLQKNKDAVKNPKFPDAPEDDAEDLQDKDDEITETLNSLRVSMQNEEKKLAPIAESQDMLLKISEAARAAGVKVSESVPYLVQRADADLKDGKKQKVSKKSKQRRRSKALAKSGRGTQNLATGPDALGAIPKEGELIYQLVNDFEVARPLQKLSIEGGFKDIQSFIVALSNMQYQVTIVKLDIDVKFQTPAQGIPQPLLAKMIIAI